MTPLRLICGLVVVALSAGGCTEPEPAPESLVIGVLAPISGSATGKDAVSGAALALEVVNGSHPDLMVPLAAGTGLPRLGGATLRLVERDSKARAEVALTQVSELVEDEHVSAVVLADSVEVAAATASQLQRLRTPLVDASSSADYLTELGLDWYFRIGPADRSFVETSLGLVRRQIGGTGSPRIAILAESGADGPTMMTQIRQTATAAGASVVAQTQLPAGGSAADQNLAPSATPDALFAYARTTKGAQQLLKTAEDVREAPPVFGLGPGFAGLERRTDGNALLRPMPWSEEYAQRSPTGRSVRQLYRQRFGRPMTQAAAHAFTATITVAMAVDAAGSADSATIRTTLRQTSVPPAQMIMPWDGLRFGSDGQNQLATVVIEQWRDSGFQLVYPSELASGPVEWTRPGSGA